MHNTKYNIMFVQSIHLVYIGTVEDNTIVHVI